MHFAVRHQSADDMRARLLVALAAGFAIVLGSPYTGQVRGAIQASLPDQYRLVVGGLVVGAVAVAIGVALLRIRDHRAQRYGAIAAAVAGGAIYAALTSTGNADVDVVERFHFVEYGVLTWLFYRVWRARADVTALLFPALAAVIVGTVDEGFQWLVPARVGELHDVLLNGAAIACGLVFSVGLDGATAVTAFPNRHGRRALAWFLSAAILTLALFVYAVHLGHEVRDVDGWFLSRYSADDLRKASRDRMTQWRSDPPRVLRRVSIEDHYLAEGLWHIQRRNEVKGFDAWKENLILEKYFAPVLEVPTYATPSGAKWPPEQRQAMAAAVGNDARPFISTANPYPIYLWNTAAFWGVVSALVAFVVGILGPGR